MRDWLGDIEIGDRWARWTGRAGDSSLHRHFSAQAVFARHPVTVFDAAGRPVTGRLILIEPLAPHRIECGARAELLFVEPPFRPPAVARLLGEWRVMHRAEIVGAHSGAGYWAGWGQASRAAGAEIDARIVAAIAEIDRRLEDGPLRLDGFAAGAGLSPDRFRHLFAHEMETPFRRYLLWRRLVRATERLRGGCNVTEAAHAAGFADAAHFARVLKSAFGIRATQALAGER